MSPVIRRVFVSRRAEKALVRLPGRIQAKLRVWRRAVERLGLHEVRKFPGFHDEPLLGGRLGQRSIRLSRGYRAIYRVLPDGESAEVLEVGLHEY